MEKHMICHHDQYKVTIGSSQALDIHRGCVQDMYEMKGLLGEGGFSKVYLAGSLRNPEIQVAIKVIAKNEVIENEGTLDLIGREIEIMTDVDHVRVVSLFEVYECSQEICLVMQLAKGGDLYDRLAEQGCLNEDTAKTIIFQLLEALTELHTNGIVHRDIKPENILFLDDCADSPIVLADFGLSDYSQDISFECPVSGTPAYIAPEILCDVDPFPYEAQDLWGCGLILFTMVAGHHPFFRRQEEDTLKAVLHAKYYLKESLSEECKDLLSKLLCRNAALRISAQDALFHPWFDDVKKVSQQLDHFQDIVSRWISYFWRE